MISTDMESQTSVECLPPFRIDADCPRVTTARRCSIRWLMAHYRLQMLALETQVTSLTPELDRTEQRLQERIVRYEEILRNRPDRDTVVVTATDG